MNDHQVSTDGKLNSIMESGAYAFTFIKDIIVGNGGFVEKPRVLSNKDIEYDRSNIFI